MYTAQENDIMELESELEDAQATCNRYEEFLRHIIDMTSVELRDGAHAVDMVNYIKGAAALALESK